MWASDMVLQRGTGAVEALLVRVPERVQTLLLGALKDAGHSVDAHVETLERGAEREAHKVVAWGREEVAAVSRVDVEEDARNDDALLLETLLEEGLEGVLDGPCMQRDESERTRPLLRGEGRCSKLSQT